MEDEHLQLWHRRLPSHGPMVVPKLLPVGPERGQEEVVQLLQRLQLASRYTKEETTMQGGGAKLAVGR